LNIGEPSASQPPRSGGINGALLVALTLGVCFLLPILRSPLLGDDAFNSYMPGYMQYHGESWLQFMHEYDQRLIDSIGRWLPGTTLLFITMWSATQNALPIKIAQIAAIAVNMWIFYGLIRRLSASNAFAILATLFVIPTFQIRLFYDPVAGIMLDMQIVVGATLLAASLLWDYQDDRKVWKLILASGLYTWALLTYETAYLYIFVFLLVAYARTRNWGRTAVIMAGPALAAAALVVTDLYLRHERLRLVAGLPLQANEYVVHFEPLTTLRTWWYQTIGSVPLEYVFYDPRHYFPAIGHVLFRPSGAAAVIAILAIIAGAFVLRKVGDGYLAPGTFPWVRLLLLGLLLSFLPGFPMSISPRWQVEVVPGQAYLPVYNAGFGTALLLALAAWLLVGRFLKDPRAAFAAAVCYTAVLVTVFQANAITLPIYNPVWNWGRQNLVASLKDGLLDDVPAGSNIFVDQSYPFFFSQAYIWDSRYLFYLYTHRRVVIDDPLGVPGYAALCPSLVRPGTCTPSVPGFDFHSISSSYDDGYISLAKIERVTRTTAGLLVPISSRAWIVDRGGGGTIRPAAAAVHLAARDFRLMRSGPDYRLFEATSSCGPINTRAFADENVSIMTFGDAFYGKEGTGTRSWRWSKRHSSMSVTNSLETPQTVDVSFSVASLVPTSHIVITTGTTTTRATLIAPYAYRRRLHLPPYGTVTITFDSDAPKPAALADPRDIHFGVFDASADSEAHC
jgi:hypothetical protein